MTNKIIYFPVAAGSGIAQIQGYRSGPGRVASVRSTQRVELLIVIWFSGWAMLAAAECIRQMSFLAV